MKVAFFDGRSQTLRVFRAAARVRPLNQSAREIHWGYASVLYMPYCPV